MGKLLIFLTLILTSFLFTKASDLVLIEAKVYKVDELDDSVSLKDLLAKATLEHSPRIISQYGKEAGLRFSYPKQSTAENSAVEILVLSNKSSKTYNIDINLINGQNKNISRIYDHPIGQPFIVSTVIDGATRIIKVDVTESSANENLASKKEPNNTKRLAQATYILQVSSNLKCDNLDIELISDKLDTPQYVKFTSSAYAAANLSAGEYSFGNIICSSKEGRREFDMLKDKILPFSLSAGKVYYGGRFILQKVKRLNPRGASEILTHCDIVSSVTIAKGVGGGSVCLGVTRVGEPAQVHYQINAFAPEVTDEDIATVRSALSFSENQLLYLPLEYKKN